MKLRLYLLIIFVICPFLYKNASAAFDARKEITKLMRKAGMEQLLSAPVRVIVPQDGPISIFDDGIFIVQHSILDVSNAPEPNVIIDHTGNLNKNADKLVIVTHGWFDKGQGHWPGEMASAVYSCVDPNQWLCGSFDWKGGSTVLSSVHAAEYGRDIAGMRLAAAVANLGRSWKHIHLIGHSAGSWTIQSAARSLAAIYPDAMFHLTFLDAYVPNGWNPDELGFIFENQSQQRSHCWAEHYFTKDFTFTVTQHKLKWAHNVDISAVDPFICEHEFPYRWYMATITGSYRRWDEKKYPVHCALGNTEYGFARSKEYSPQNWNDSLQLLSSSPIILFQKASK